VLGIQCAMPANEKMRNSPPRCRQRLSTWQTQTARVRSEGPRHGSFNSLFWHCWQPTDGVIIRGCGARGRSAAMMIGTHQSWDCDGAGMPTESPGAISEPDARRVVKAEQAGSYAGRAARRTRSRSCTLMTTLQDAPVRARPRCRGKRAREKAPAVSRGVDMQAAHLPIIKASNLA